MGILHEDLYTFIMVPQWILFRNVSNKSCKENKKTYFMFNNLFQKLCSLRDNVQKHGREKQATDGNMIHVLCMLHN
jgi:hypothetical protein